jgi:hypothetical protein
MNRMAKYIASMRLSSTSKARTTPTTILRNAHAIPDRGRRWYAGYTVGERTRVVVVEDRHSAVFKHRIRVRGWTCSWMARDPEADSAERGHYLTRSGK